MHRRSLIIAGLLLVLALPLSASQFIELSFDEVANGASYIVRGTVGETWSAWDDSHEVIYTYATIRVNRYFGETAGPDTLLIREVGGTVDGYTQEAIGFPVIRSGEDVVLMLSRWEDSADFRIHAFNQGKFLVKNRGGRAVLIGDAQRQGDARLSHEGPGGGVRANATAEETGLFIEEFAQMVDDARAGRGNGRDAGHKRQ